MSTDVARRVLIQQAHEGWTIRIHDDQPIAEGKTCASESRVEILRGSQVVRGFNYPSYRIWTLLAHWTDDLGELEAQLPVPSDAVTRDRVDAIASELLEWAEGRRSHINEFMALEDDTAHRQQTLVHAAQADVAEVQRLAAALAVLRSELDR